MALIAVRHGSVTDPGADADVIVNASNTLLKLGSGVSGAIRAACGAGFQASLDEVLQQHGGGLQPGDAVLTPAGAHPRARFMVHVAVMDYRTGASAPHPDAERIRRGSAELWRRVEEVPLPQVSVAMVALGAGTGNLGVRLPTVTACETLKEHLARVPSKIKRVVFHGYTLVEYMNVLDVVSRGFDLDLSEVPVDVREFIQQQRQREEL